MTAQQATSYTDLFAQLTRPAFIPFFVLGDPDEATSLAMIRTAVEAGADVLELGIPFSDPIADGPTIQKADIRALEAGITCARALEMIGKIREFTTAPIGLLMYYNLIHHYGIERFYRDAAQAGVNSVLIADLCIDNAEEVLPHVKANGMDAVFMVTPNTTDDRVAKITHLCSGFVYTVSLMGVTGERQELSNAVAPLVNRLKQNTTVPVCVGFGVSRPEHAAELTRSGVDGVIVGSAIVKLIETNLSDTATMKTAIHQLVTEMVAAIDSAATK